MNIVKSDKDYTPPFRVGRKQGKAVLDANGLEVAFFKDSKLQAVMYCDYLNRTQEETSAKNVILDELNEQGHPEKVEDVIFWALEHYAKSEPKGTWGRIIAYAIKERILKVERDKS